MNIFCLLETSQPFLIAAAGVLGALVGSFLNVVIYRLPIMLDREWTSESLAFINHKIAHPANHTGAIKVLADKKINAEDSIKGAFNLITPRSRCPKCNHLIGVLENIPLLSYLFLLAKCRHCKTTISPRYFFVELLTVCVSIFNVSQYGFDLLALYACLFSYLIIALTFIDFDCQLLPDELTLLGLWIGLLININSTLAPLSDAILGAALGYLVLWSFYWLFKLATKKDGLGYGDFKLLAFFGAWLGWQALPFIIIISAFVGSIIGLLMLVLGLLKRSEPMPYGPYLCLAAWCAYHWGDIINQHYLTFSPFQSWPLL